MGAFVRILVRGPRARAARGAVRVEIASFKKPDVKPMCKAILGGGCIGGRRGARRGASVADAVLLEG